MGYGHIIMHVSILVKMLHIPTNVLNDSLVEVVCNDIFYGLGCSVLDFIEAAQNWFIYEVAYYGNKLTNSYL